MLAVSPGEWLGSPTGRSVTARSVEIIHVEDAHVALLADFYRKVWDRDATAEGVLRARHATAAANPISPGRHPPTFLFLDNGIAVGHVGTIPVVFWNGRAEIPAHWVKGLMVLPEFQNGPVGFLLLKEAVRQLGCAMAIVGAAAAQRLFRALDFQDYGAIPNYLRVLKPEQVLRRLDLSAVSGGRANVFLSRALEVVQQPRLAKVLGWASSGMLRLWAAPSNLRTRGLEVGISDEVSVPAGDQLWESVRGSIAAAPARGGNHIRWRYDTGPDAPYRAVCVRDDAAVVGSAVVRRPRARGDRRLKGIRVATLSDILYSPMRSNVGLAALTGAEAAACELDADALLCSATHRSLTPLLGRRAFIPVPANLRLLGRISPDAGEIPHDLRDWWITRGDGNADEAF
jgi:GNAT superfamily N-acetyltransferase